MPDFCKIALQTKDGLAEGEFRQPIGAAIYEREDKPVSCRKL
jgi:hypothetical protein